MRGPICWQGVAGGTSETTSELERCIEFALTAVGHAISERVAYGLRDQSCWPRTEQPRTRSASLVGSIVYRSPEGRYVATVVSPRVLAIMDARSGVRFVDVFRGEEVGRIAVSTNRGLIALGVASQHGIIATVSDDGTVEVWRWESGERLATFANVIPHSALVHTFALLSPQRVANAEWLLHLDLNFASISSSESSHPAQIVAVKFSEGNSTLFTVDAQGGLREWNTNLDLLRAVQGNKSARTVAAISQPSDRIVTLADNGIVRQLAAQRGFPSEIRLQSASAIHCMTAMQPESTAATGNDLGEIERWELIAVNDAGRTRSPRTCQMLGGQS